ncbi:MAG TPA: N-acetyltransferase [Ruminococcaceae bacterium]|jgi:GNAT superfamily N-acetyltransferase|nr:MAG TPA: acetyltransferase domain containing protein [Caudoviricetes sp.]HBM03322.1 N-acetyltransferase [Oscillospiraceae bacterium]
MKIIKYEEIYRDDMIFMVLQAKDALGRKPTINPDLLDIQVNYLDCDDMFWLAIDENDRVVGCVGYSRIADTEEAFLHRLYIKPSLKRKGIGSKLLDTAECWMRKNGIVVSKVHLGSPKEQWFESYAFYPKHGYIEYEPRYMMKVL